MKRNFFFLAVIAIATALVLTSPASAQRAKKKVAKETPFSKMMRISMLAGATSMTCGVEKRQSCVNKLFGSVRENPHYANLTRKQRLLVALSFQNGQKAGEILFSNHRREFPHEKRMTPGSGPVRVPNQEPTKVRAMPWVAPTNTKTVMIDGKPYSVPID